ncbi:MAG TPA: DinB family protein [Armatimonadota bacterium]|nr:DinB family protein [Armatimonadota bacterium]
MTLRDLLLHETERAYDWDEMCMKAATRGLTTEAARRSTDGVWHCPIWSIIDHVARCDLMYMIQAFGDPPKPVAEPGDTIESLLEYLEACHAYRVHCLEQIAEDDLAKPVPTAWHGESAANLFWTMIQHDVSHAGQITVIREALGV